MKNPIWKETYNGQGIYWHGSSDYGDETNVWGQSLSACRAKIDARIVKQFESRPLHEKYWDTLSHEDRQKWRRASRDSDKSASQLAFENHPTFNQPKGTT